MQKIELEWMGPFSVDTPDSRRSFIPPHQPGVYLWAVVQHSDSVSSFKVSYVGQTSNLRNRLYEHISGILGGLSSLYGDEHLVQGEIPEKKLRKYEPSHANLLNEFISDFPKYSQLAYQNVMSYRFFWAEMPGYSGSVQSCFRKAVESALIKYTGHQLQNTNLSLEPRNSPKILIESNFAKAEALRMLLPSTMSYGESGDCFPMPPLDHL